MPKRYPLQHLAAALHQLESVRQGDVGRPHLRRVVGRGKLLQPGNRYGSERLQGAIRKELGTGSRMTSLTREQFEKVLRNVVLREAKIGQRAAEALRRSTRTQAKLETFLQSGSEKFKGSRAEGKDERVRAREYKGYEKGRGAAYAHELEKAAHKKLVEGPQSRRGELERVLQEGGPTSSYLDGLKESVRKAARGAPRGSVEGKEGPPQIPLRR